MNILNKKPLLLTGLLLVLTAFCASPQNQDLGITVHLRGVYECKISLLPLTGPKALKPILEVAGVKNGKTARLVVPAEYLPGQFVLRFDYKEKQESTPYPSEKNILMSKQNLELWSNPKYANNPDSTWFQKGEKENSAFALFSEENSRKMKNLGVLQAFLLNYDQPESNFYNQGIGEYEIRRRDYNQWLNTQTIRDSALFASNIYRFSKVPEISWKGSERDRERSLISHYFDEMDFSNPNLIRTSQLTEWMDTYVNLNMKSAISVVLRDSIISGVARSAIEKSKTGSSIVYGWMVDYFYKGFEANNIPAGMKVLEPYLNDPLCLTSKRQEIGRRLRGMESLIPGIKAPDIQLNDATGRNFDLKSWNPPTQYILLFFWSADCSHCIETVADLYPWQQQAANKQRISVAAVGLNDSEPIVKIWDQKIKDLPGWLHVNAIGGVQSKVANDYYILATPVMVLLDSKTKEIISMPVSVRELQSIVK